MSADVARGHGGDGGGDDRPLHVRYPNGWQDHEETSGERSSGSSRCHTLLGKDPGERKAKSQFELTTTMQSPLAKISARAFEQHLGPDLHRKQVTVEESALVLLNPDETRDIAFWLDPKNAARAAQNAQNQAKSTEMLRLKDLGPNTPTGVPYTDDEIMAMARDVLDIPEPRCRHTTDVDESQHEVGSRSGSGEDGDDEPGKDEEAGEDEDVDGDVDS
ncbi:hypothetical protein Tco_1296561 [Tanacetum coccineum]